MLDNKAEIILKLESVSKQFQVESNQSLTAVNKVSLDLYQGECLAIVGESGCGKSTLGKLITCIERVSEGKIYFKAKEITKLKASQLRELRREMQIVFQDPFNVFSPRMKIGDFLNEPFINYKKMNKKSAREESKRLLEAVELSEPYLVKFPHQLSGGELQRVVIARAMALNPSLIVCDEVTSALDVSIQKQIIQLLTKIHQETGMTNLFISHDLALVQSFCDRVIVMYLGNIVEVMKSNELGYKVHHPYTQELLNSVFSIHGHRKKELNVLFGEPPSPMNRPKGCPFSKRCVDAMETCFRQMPELREYEDNHLIACHRREK